MENQIILIDKPAGISSFGVVAKVRGELRAQFGHKVKVGHTGTLDPFATGLLILLSGKYTKKSSEFLKLDKVYEATMKLGYTSTTGDPEGEIIEYPFSEHSELFPQEKASNSPDSYNISPLKKSEKQPQQYPNEGGPELGKARSSAARPWRWAGRTRPELDTVEAVTNSFIGKIQQTPPRFSAIKVGGQRAYKLARKGENFEIPSREVSIYSIEILSYDYPELKIRVHCSSGTYIRTLAEDIGKALGTGAYLTALRRIQIGDYTLANARQLVL